MLQDCQSAQITAVLVFNEADDVSLYTASVCLITKEDDDGLYNII